MINDLRYTQWLRDTFGIMMRWTETGEDAADYPALEQIRAEFDKACAALARVLQDDELVGEAGVGPGLTAELEAARKERDDATAKEAELKDQLDNAQALVETLAEEKARAIEDAQSKAEELETLNERLKHELETQASWEAENSHLKAEVEAAQAKVDGTHARLADVENRAKQAQAELERESEKASTLTAQIAVLESTAAQRDEELSQVWSTLKETEAAAAEATEKAKKHKKRGDKEAERLSKRLKEIEEQSRSETSRLSAEVSELTKLLSQSESEGQAAIEQLAEAERQHSHTTGSLNAQLDQKTSELQARFSEIARLTAMLDDGISKAKQSDEESDWLREMAQVKESFPKWWSLMPTAWRRHREHRRFRRAGLFDAQSYLNQYPDVAGEGMDPVRHYIVHGMREGRIRPQ